MQKISVISGGFDPIHSGHIKYIKAAKEEGDLLAICLNSDHWLQKKKGKSFLPFEERKLILESMKYVDIVIDFEDDELGSCINGLEKLKATYPDHKIIFCNGGDRNSTNIPEMNVKDIEFKFSVGGSTKLNSSSWILKKWKYDFEERVWGSFYNLYEDPISGIKVKELIVAPNQGMSFQRHFKRSEIWLVSKGSCVVNYSKNNPNSRKSKQLDVFDSFKVAVKEWHQITNPFDKECRIIEIQYGEQCTEKDIERIE